MPNIPNLQAVLTSGATLNKDNTIEVLQDKQLVLQVLQGGGFGVIALNANGFYSLVARGNQLTLQAAKDGKVCTLIASENGFTIETDGVSKKVCQINVADNFSDDASAATGGIKVGELYHTNGAVKVRLV